jgi:hypothetical protein
VKTRQIFRMTGFPKVLNWTVNCCNNRLNVYMETIWAHLMWAYHLWNKTDVFQAHKLCFIVYCVLLFAYI